MSVELRVLVLDPRALLQQELVVSQRLLFLVLGPLHLLRQRQDLVQLPLTTVLRRQLPGGKHTASLPPVRWSTSACLVTQF